MLLYITEFEVYCKLQTRKMKFHNLQYEPKNRVSKIFVIFLCLNRGREGGGGEDVSTQTFEFCRPHNEIWPTKLTNHSAWTMHA